MKNEAPNGKYISIGASFWTNFLLTKNYFYCNIQIWIIIDIYFTFCEYVICKKRMYYERTF